MCSIDLIFINSRTNKWRSLVIKIASQLLLLFVQLNEMLELEQTSPSIEAKVRSYFGG